MIGRAKIAQEAHEISIPVKGGIQIEAMLSIVDRAESIVLMGYGSGSARYSARNCFLADEFNRAGYSTLLVDFLTPREEQIDLETGEYRFDIELLVERTKTVTRWLKEGEKTGGMDPVFFGSNASAASALATAAEMGEAVKAVICQGGRCDLVEYEMQMVKSPSLFIVGENDHFITGITRKAIRNMQTEKKLVIIEGVSHYFEEPGAIEEVAFVTRTWLCQVLCPSE